MARQSDSDSAAQRALRIAELLFGRVLDGYSNKEIADALGYSACNVSRDLETLRSMGWAEKLDTGRWALTTKPVALMRKYQDYMADLSARRDAFDARVQAQAKNL